MIRITSLSKMYGAARIEPVPGEVAGRPAARPQTLLVVEDDPTMRLAMACMLADTDRQVVTAASAEEAMAHLQLVEPDVIICDYVLAGMNGREFCAALRGHWRWQQVPIIMVTGLDIPAVLADLLENGADDVITKPLHAEDLRTRVQLQLCTAARAVQARDRANMASTRDTGTLPQVPAPVALRRGQLQALVEL